MANKTSRKSLKKSSKIASRNAPRKTAARAAAASAQSRYIVSFWLRCYGAHPGVLSRFAEFWNPLVECDCSLVDLGMFDSPDPETGEPDPGFTAAVDRELKSRFAGEMAKDLGLGSPSNVIQVDAYKGNPWSPPSLGSPRPHEGGPRSINVIRLGGIGAVWRIRVPSGSSGSGFHEGTVYTYAVWRHFA